MARKDVDIRVRALGTDKASRDAKKIAEALKLIGEDGRKASESASKTGGALNALSADLAKLQGNAAGLKAFGGIVSDLDRTASSVQRLDNQLQRSQKGFDSLRQSTTTAARATTDLRNSIDREQQALASRQRILEATTAKQRANNEELRAATRAQEALNGARRKGVAVSGNQATRGVGIESGAPRSSARDSFGAFLAADIASAEASKRQLQGAVAGLNTAIQGNRSAIKAYGTDLKSAEANEREFANETQRAGNALVAMRADLHQARQRLGDLDSAAGTASKNLGGLAISQKEVENATARATAEIARMRGQLEATGRSGLSVIPAAEGDENNRRRQIENLRLLNAEHEKAHAEVRRLAGEMRSAAAPTERLGAAFGTAQARAKETAAALNQQRVALRETAQQAHVGFAAWARAYNPIAGSADRAASAQERLNASARSTVSAAGQIAPMAQRNAGALRQQAAATDQASSGLLNFGRNTRTTLSFMQRMRGEILALTAAYIGFHAAIQQGSSAIGAYQELEAIQSRLGAVMKQDTAAVATEISWLRSQSQRLGIEFGTLGNQYAKFAVAADTSNFSLENTRRIFLSVAEAGRVNKLSLDQLNGTFLAIEQIISKGKFTSEEVRRQLGDRLPGAFATLASAMGVTTAELDKMMSNGELLATESNLLKFADELTRRFGPQLASSLDTLTTDIGKFQTEIFNIRLAIAQGMVEPMREAIQTFNDFARSAEGAEAFRAIGEAAGRLIAILAQVPQYFELIVFAAKAFVAVKLAQWVTSIGGGLTAAAASFTSYGNAVSVATAQGQKLTLAQRTLMVGVRSMAGTLAAYEARLRATAAASATAQFGTLAFARTLGVVRTAMLGAAAVARTMWAAIGGPVGLAIAGVTLVFANWKSDADRATAALNEHERQVQAVVNAYNTAEGATKNWADAIKAVTLTESVDDVENLKSTFDDITRSIQQYGRMAQAAFSDFPIDSLERGQAKIIADLTDDLREGRIGVQAFREAMDSLANNNAFDEQLREIAKELVRMSGASEDGAASLLELEEAIDVAQAKLRLKQGVATDADKALLGLTETVKDANETFDKTEFVETYTKAIDDLKEKIPSLADEMERLKNVTELNATAWKGLVAAWNASDYTKLFEIAGLWGMAQANLSQEKQNKFLDAYGAGDKSVIERIIYVEGGQSGGGPSTSSARGIGQFTEGTWLQYLNRLYPELSELNRTQKLALRTSEEHATRIMETFTRENQNALLRAGVGAGATETYLAHFLGSGDAVKVLLANPEELAANIVNPKSVAANPSVFKSGMTIQDLINWSAGKMGDGSKQLGGGQTENEKQRVDEAKATKQRLADLDHQIAQQKLVNDGKEREAAIEDAIRAAKAENANLTERELATIREKTGALWDEQNARHEIELSEERVNQLYQLRQQLLEQMQMAQESGDMNTVAALKEEITGVDLQLTGAIEKAIAMWEAIGGPEADAAIAKLRTMQGSIKAAQQQTGLFGISMQAWKGIFDSAVGGMVSAFDRMAQAIANGENAFKAFGQGVLSMLSEVLLQIARTIIQMQILKLLMNIGGAIGGGFGGALQGFAGAGLSAMGGGTFHTGGIAGIGSDNFSATLANAFAGPYHTGGIAGFAPDEVGATLKRGEEILTEEDPRHRFNLGETMGRSAAPEVNIVNTIDSGDFVSRGMQTQRGQKAILNFIHDNPDAVRRELGV